MANTSVNLSSLDFDSNKQDFIDFLLNQSIFKDYNFEGSNINVLLDILSYNTFKNAFFLNMVASEMFLDSAQKLDSIVSHAKELNYVPRSAKSSLATVSFSIDTSGIISPFIVPKGTMFSGSNANGNYTFTTREQYSFASTNSTYQIANLDIYEGAFINDTYLVDYSIEDQRFVLSNPNIDTDSLTITIQESSVNTSFLKVNSLFGLSNTSDIFFLQAAENGQYEVVFGDGLFGRKPDNLGIIFANYRVASGPTSDGISNFTCLDDLGTLNGGSGIISIIDTTVESGLGSLQESKESIKFSAPRFYATQQRAVASDDYESLILDNFGGEISDVKTYGGELLNPPQYGRVVICLKPASGLIASDTIKNNITNYMKNYVSLPTRTLMSDPDYFYCQIITDIDYNPTQTTNLSTQIYNNVIEAIDQFNDNNLGTFGKSFKYSRFINAIDEADAAIISNDTRVKLIKKLAPLLDYATSYTIEFNNQIKQAESDPSVGFIAGSAFFAEPSITSSAFTFRDSNGVTYPYSYIRDDNFGNLVVYIINNNQFVIVKSNIGTVDYDTGIVTINKLLVSDYSTAISIYAETEDPNFLADKTKILIIDPNDVTITLNQVVE